MYITLSACVSFGLAIPESFASAVIVILTFILIGKLVEEKSSVHMMFFLGYSVFIFFPSLVNWYYLGVDFNLFFCTSIVVIFFLLQTKKTKVKEFVNYGKVPKMIFLILSFVACVLITLNVDRVVGPLITFLIVLLSLSFRQDKVANNTFYFSIFLLTLVVFILNFWTGNARTVLIGWIVLSALQYAYSINFKINKYIFVIVPAFASTLFGSRDFLNLKFSGFEYALNDSAFSPYRLASSFIDRYNLNGFDPTGYWDQVLYFFFMFIPRAIWEDKPNGFGFEYTIRHLDPRLVDAGHSVASTLIGDHLYFMGYLGIVTSLVFFSLIAFATNAFYEIKSLNGNGVLIFSASMMVLVWGGMTSFSARITLPLIFFTVIFIFLKKLLRRKVRLVWGR